MGREKVGISWVITGQEERKLYWCQMIKCIVEYFGFWSLSIGYREVFNIFELECDSIISVI